MSVGDWKNHSEQFETHKNADGFLKYLNEQQGPIFQRLPTFQHCLRRMLHYQHAATFIEFAA